MPDTAPQNDQPHQDNRGSGQRPNRPKISWGVAQTFSDPKSGTAVVVFKSGGIRPMFSFMIGRLRDDGSVAPNMRFHTNRNTATFEVETDYATVLGGLMVKAQKFIVTEMQWDWAQNVDDQIARESRHMDYGSSKPGGDTVRHPGKTARDNAKHNRK